MTSFTSHEWGEGSAQYHMYHPNRFFLMTYPSKEVCSHSLSGILQYTVDEPLVRPFRFIWSGGVCARVVLCCWASVGRTLMLVSPNDTKNNICDCTIFTFIDRRRSHPRVDAEISQYFPCDNMGTLQPVCCVPFAQAWASCCWEGP